MGEPHEAQVNSLWAAGHYGTARDATESARRWTIAGVVTGLIGSILYAVFLFSTDTAPYTY